MKVNKSQGIIEKKKQHQHGQTIMNVHMIRCVNWVMSYCSLNGSRDSCVFITDRKCTISFAKKMWPQPKVILLEVCRVARIVASKMELKSKPPGEGKGQVSDQESNLGCFRPFAGRVLFRGNQILVCLCFFFCLVVSL